MAGLAVVCSLVAALIGAGLWMEKYCWSPRNPKAALGLIMGVMFMTLAVSVSAALAAEPAAGAAQAAGNAVGLGLIGAALATGLACIGAGIAVAFVGAAALGVIGEKPALFGRTLIYMGLAEGIAIYGIVISLFILGRI